MGRVVDSNGGKLIKLTKTRNQIEFQYEDASGVNRPLLEQLKIPGCLVFPTGEKELQALVRICKDRAGIREEDLAACHFVKLRGRYGWED